MDLYSIPTKTLLEPVKLSKSNARLSHPILFTEEDIKYMKKHPECRIEIRGLRLCKEGFKNSWPNFSSFSVSPGSFKKSFDLPEREQSRKRKDFPLDVKSFLSLKKNRKFTINMDFLPNHTPQEKNTDDYSYAVGVYLVQPVIKEQILEYFVKYECEQVSESIGRINRQLTLYSNDDIISDELKISLVCPIVRSFGSLKIPVRGFKCEHVD